MMSRFLIDLTDVQPFAKGDNRLCFIHPGDPTRCLKVMKPGLVGRQFAAAPWHKKLRGKDSMDDNQREIKAYGQRAVRQGGTRVWEHLPRWHGVVQTTLGTANETDFISAAPGEAAPTLESLLQVDGLSRPVTESLEVLGAWLRHTQVLSRNLLPHNIVARPEGEGYRLFIIDGIGAPTIAAITGFSAAWRRHYIERRIQRMWLRAQWEAGGRQDRWEDVERAGR
jgi:hypothetical protein